MCCSCKSDAMIVMRNGIYHIIFFNLISTVGGVIGMSHRSLFRWACADQPPSLHRLYFCVEKSGRLQPLFGPPPATISHRDSSVQALNGRKLRSAQIPNTVWALVDLDSPHH
ncbi:hypothetical protein L484_010083 [Morus notabilis]|uniref:Uncharacterized protein n=1 Tax=Morus notabilis TaxID=981085 RepID=W9SB46_9ROSA|nr:hypothetical protein L484_010083 [Morus notabilis]